MESRRISSTESRMASARFAALNVSSGVPELVIWHDVGYNQAYLFVYCYKNGSVKLVKRKVKFGDDEGETK